ncbi:MAG TPA: hypothetical protein VJ869_00770 [Sphaerochaeta sp.]|nr:hypothetical protein [Sphaerochaeta sp.]
MNIVESTKAKLKNKTVKNNRSYNEIITVYGWIIHLVGKTIIAGKQSDQQT